MNSSIPHLLHPFGVRIIGRGTFPGVPFGHPRLFILGRFAAPFWGYQGLFILGRFAAPFWGYQGFFPRPYLT